MIGLGAGDTNRRCVVVVVMSDMYNHRTACSVCFVPVCLWKDSGLSGSSDVNAGGAAAGWPRSARLNVLFRLEYGGEWVLSTAGPKYHT